jgi:hypothetical protein
MSSYHLAWCSDLHINFLNAEKQLRFLDSLRALSASALVITGDISTSLRLGAALDALATVGKPVYFVTGNHDYYCSDFASTEAVISGACQTSRRLVRLGRGEIISLSPGVTLIGHGGWADGRAGMGRASLAQLNDFLLIKDLKVPKDQLFDKLHQLGHDIQPQGEALLHRCRRRNEENSGPLNRRKARASPSKMEGKATPLTFRDRAIFGATWPTCPSERPYVKGGNGNKISEAEDHSG